MTIKSLYIDAGIIKDNTEIFVRDDNFNLLARGMWFNDNVLDYQNKEIESFQWQSDNKVFIDIKGDEEDE